MEVGTVVLKDQCKVLKSKRNKECIHTWGWGNNRKVHGLLSLKRDEEGNYGNPMWSVGDPVG